MRYLSLIILILLMSLHGKCQSVVPCSCQGLVDINYSKPIPIYDKPNGKLKSSVRQDVKSDDCLMFFIDKDSSDYFHIELTYALKHSSFKGWVMKANYLGTFSRVYNDTLKLLSMPVAGAAVRSIIPVCTNDLLPITKCKGQWVYIRYKGRIEGWMRKEDQCPNPYTTCN